jgi:putative hemolysin
MMRKELFMQLQTQPERIFNLDVNFKDPLQNKLFGMMKSPIEHVLSFPRINRLYNDVSRMKDSRPFSDKILNHLNVSYELPDADRAKIASTSGPLIVVANHPFGGIETVILASVLCSMRTDVKFLANYMLNVIPEIRDLLITVNPFQGTTSMRDNIRPIREAIQWVKDGGMLVVFPAGAVSHFDAHKGAITDPDWSPNVARIIRKTGASVLPVFFKGTNSATFHMAGMVHPLFRTALLLNEFLNKTSKTITMRAGDRIPFEMLNTFEQDQDMTEYLRLRTYLLELRSARTGQRKPGTLLPKQKKAHSTPIAFPRDQEPMQAEINNLLPSQILLESNEHIVVQAEAAQIPNILFEIGRLRELTFRAVGEGTGKALDLDQFDASYVHLFIWNRAKREVVGAYRIGRVDELIRKYGLRGLYTSTLFRYDPRIIGQLQSALEMGRSFVRPEYQKSYTPLLLLWKGIARFVVDNPQYKCLFGPVSITDEYQAVSKQLIVSYLKMSKYRHDMAGLVRPRRPHRSRPLKGWDIDAVVRMLKDDENSISELISCIEEDRKGIPVLLKQYLKLGGRLVGFNVDPAFGNALDGLILVDLTQTEPRMLERYLGKDGAHQFLSYHESLGQERLAPCA